MISGSEVRPVSSSRKEFTNIMDDVHGENGVCDVFQHKYESLYTNVPYNIDKMNAIAKTVHLNVSSCCTNGNCSAHYNITNEDAIHADHKMMLNKADALKPSMH